MSSRSRVLVCVNAPELSCLGERARCVVLAAGGGSILYREGGRLQALWAFVGAVLRTRPAIVYAIDNAVAPVGAALVARSVVGSRVILDAGDPIAALVRSSGRGGALGYLAATVLERVGYGVAHTIIVRGQGLGALVRESVGRASVVIPDGFDPESASIREGRTFRQALGVSDSTLVVGVRGSASWSARLQWCYGRDVVEAVGRARRNDLAGVVIAVGDGVPHLKRLAEKLGVQDRVRFVEPLQGEGQWEQLGGVDVALSTQTNDAVGQSRTTMKLVEYLAAGKFILASRVGTAATVLPEDMLVQYDGAWDEGYFERLAGRIDALPDRTLVRKRGLEIGRRSTAFAYPALMPKWEEIFAALS